MSDTKAMQRLCGLMRKAVQQYEMLAPGDRVLVGVSGGKDSVALTIGLARLRQYLGFPFEVVAVTLDPQFGGKPVDYSALEALFRQYDVSYEVRRTLIGPIVFDYRNEKNPCSLCAKMRRGSLHAAAEELDCNKVALGHHLDDAIETFYMNLWREGRIGCFSPVTELSDRGLTLIRPLLLATEQEVRCAVKEEGFPIVKSRCPADGVTTREDTKNFVRERCRTDRAFRQKTLHALQESGIDGWRPLHPARTSKRRTQPMQMPAFEKHVWAEIDLDALRHNFRAVKARAGEMPLCAVVKADSYGHGAVECAKVFAEEGAAWLAVSCLAEARQLRKAGLTLPILILGHVEPGRVPVLIQEDITAACYSLPQAKALSEAACTVGGKVKVHLKADTGMGRIGFALRTDFDAALAGMLEACRLPGLEVTGLFQHFAVADEGSADSVAYTSQQHELFVRAYKGLAEAGFEPAVVHCDNSAGVMLHPDWPAGLPRTHCMARPGIILYGFDPSDEVRFGIFRPVMKLKTIVSMVKEMQPGQSASYGRRFTAEKPTKVATLCAGYADGYPRLLSCGKGIVEIKGMPCPVLGRVCMDQMMVDVSALPDVQEGDEAILWGGEVSDSAETIAHKTDTISYEVLCGVSRRVPRVYLENGGIKAVEDWIL